MMFSTRSRLLVLILAAITIPNVILLLRELWIHASCEDHHLTIDDVSVEQRRGAVGQLHNQIDELRRIRRSTRNELIQLYNRRTALVRQHASLRVTVDYYNTLISQLRHSVASIKQHRAEASLPQVPVVEPPLVVNPIVYDFVNVPVSPSHHDCTMDSCFNFKNCPITRELSVQLVSKTILNSSSWDDVLFNGLPYRRVSQDPCLVFVVDNTTAAQRSNANHANSVLILSRFDKDTVDTTKRISMSSVLLASAVHLRSSYRPSFDIVLPHSPLVASGDFWHLLKPLTPIFRRYFLTFVGSVGPATLSPADAGIVRSLRRIVATSDRRVATYIKLQCQRTEASWTLDTWLMCDDRRRRLEILTESTFALIIPSVAGGFVSTATLQQRLMEALTAGAIPVIVGGRFVPPFIELIEWDRALLRLPVARIGELVYILRTMAPADVMSLRRHGHQILSRHLASRRLQWLSLLALLTRRLALPLPEVPAATAAYRLVNVTSFVEARRPATADIDDYLGPLDGPVSQRRWHYRRNYSAVLTRTAAGIAADPFHRHTSTPWDPVLVTDNQFMDPDLLFRPIDSAMNTGGVEFSRSLGGNRPYEQFTVVILTFDRLAVLKTTLAEFKDLPYLNRVVVIWNSLRPPPENTQFPNIDVPIHIAVMANNSLNNRFRPLAVIETEAVLSIDDDVRLRQDEIVLGFRVWRENRDRIVGYPARFHEWDAKARRWLYRTPHTCQLSMVLTGAAFIHKHYFHLYWSQVPQAALAMVDEYTNCEDFVMNFLVSHITRKPPIKVTTRWTLQCTDCPSSLWTRPDHFRTRDLCLNRLARMFGYNPLLYSQWRADSVLFKTRLPPDKQKCFKYV